LAMEEPRYTRSALERAMKIQEIILRAASGKISWLQAADILRMHPRSLRRWRMRLDKYGYDGLLDRRRQVPSPRRADWGELQRILRLYRTVYHDFNVRHFHEIVCREHGVTLSYTYVKRALQTAGLVDRAKARGKHRRRREPRPCFGEMLHLDGSPHQWLALCPGQRQTLISIVDDATKRLLYAQLWPTESLQGVMMALYEVFTTYGLPVALYTDRAGWAAYTPKAGGPVDPSKPTQLGRALDKLGVEHILAYSPQARGRSERANRTIQGRLVNELRVAGIRSLEDANRYLREKFQPSYDAAFARAPVDPRSAFVPLGRCDLHQYLCVEVERTVSEDNTVVLDNVVMQLDKQRGRRTCRKLHVQVRHHLDGSYTVWRGPKLMGRYDKRGRAVTSARGGPASRPSVASRMAAAPW
jgi:transposase